MHGAISHKARKDSEKKTDPKAEIKELKDKMSKAIKEENFEEAARLRDEIKAREEK